MESSLILKEEQEHLDKNINKLNEKIGASKHAFDLLYSNVKEQSMYLSESYHELDDEEKMEVKATILNNEKRMHDEISKQLFYEKAKLSPFFGRVDWKEKGEVVEPVYVGIANIENRAGMAPLVCDWRAPISSLFYDFECGNAFFEAPKGKLEGIIERKRQYKIENSKFVFGIDVNETIADEILKEVLWQNTSGAMKTIVSTIQREQNEIIRNNPNVSLLIQGIAGSGKTSIALHRIAYLLYRQKETLHSEDVLVISPSLIFSKYIGNVLPELGEENIGQTTFDSIAREALKGKTLFESREEMVSDLINNPTANRKQNIDKKSSYEFVSQVQKILQNMFKTNFSPKDLVFGEIIIPAEKLKGLWENNYAEHSVATKIAWLTDFALEELSMNKTHKKGVSERIEKVLFSYLPFANCEEVLESVYSQMGLTLQEKSKGVLFYEDAAPLMLVYDFLFGLEKQQGVKCLVVDEMQDHTPAVFYLLKKLYGCTMIVLGDINQSVEHSYDENYLKQLANTLNANFVNLNTSYRSTVEISEFAQSLIGLKGCKNFARHGAPVTVASAPNYELSVLAIEKTARALMNETAQTAVICVDPLMQETLQQSLSNLIPCTSLFEMETNKLIVTTSSECKGMEFDNVIVFGEKPTSLEQRSALHIACTRALHTLVVIFGE